MTFQECVLECARNKDFLREYDRLRRSNLSQKGAPIDLIIDESSGRLESEVRQFIADVFDVVWLPLMLEEDAA